MRVLIIDDSAFMRKALAAMLASDPSIQVIDSAKNGEEGIEKIKQFKPDVVTLDIEMPVMDGLTALSKIRLLPEPRPAVLICSTLTVQGSKESLKALRLGAADVIAKDPNAIGAGNETIRKDIIARVKAIAPASNRSALKATSETHALSREFAWNGRHADLVVIGSSTGGPPILEQVLTAIPADFTQPVVVAQHMPAMFTKSMSERLSEVCKVKVVHAEADCMIQPGTVYITMGGKHSRVHRLGMGKFRLEVSAKPEDALYKPCVNELFGSAAAAGKERVLGVMLTGMGDDGAIGAKALAAAGGIVLAQLGETCAVYGMPKAVVENGSACATLTPQQLGMAVAQLAPSMQVRGKVA